MRLYKKPYPVALVMWKHFVFLIIQFTLEQEDA